MDVGLSTMTRWVKQLRDERAGKTPKASYHAGANWDTWAEEKHQRIEMENENIKKATALLMSEFPEQLSIIGKLRAHYPVATLLPRVWGSPQQL